MPEILTRAEVAEIDDNLAKDRLSLGWAKDIIAALITSHEALRARLEERDSFILNMQHAAKLDHDAAVNAATRKAFEEAIEMIERRDLSPKEVVNKLRRRAGEGGK